MCKILALVCLLFFIPARCSGSEQDLLSRYKEKLVQQTEKLAQHEAHLEALYDKELIACRHLEAMGMNYETILKADAKSLRHLFHKNLRIWAAFSAFTRTDALISAQESTIKDTERAILDTKRTIGALTFELALDKYFQSLEKAP